MKRKFYRLAFILIVSTALLSVLFAILHYIASERIDAGSSFLTFTYYLKKFFDLVAVFTGYGIIIYAFSRYTTMDGMKITAMFAISFAISFVYQVLGTCIHEGDFSLDFILFTIYYAFGDCFITQYIPALLVALLAYKTTAGGTARITKLVSWSNPTQRVMIIVTLVIFAINFASLLFFNILAFLIEAEWLISLEELGSILGSILETAFLYIVFQYAIYMIMHKVFEKSTQNAVED